MTMGADVVETAGTTGAARLDDAVVTMRTDLYICAGAGEAGADFIDEIGDVTGVSDEDGALAGASDGDIKEAAFLGVGVSIGRGEHGGHERIIGASGGHAEATVL